jgi:biotin operon repressor
MAESSEEIGFHKGALTTLAKEQQELAKMLNIVQQIMQGHIKALKDLGVDIEKDIKETQEKQGLDEKLKK